MPTIRTQSAGYGALTNAHPSVQYAPFERNPRDCTPVESNSRDCTLFLVSNRLTTLLLVRHATNDWVGERLAGWTPGVHLNEAGQQQAFALAERLAPMPIKAIYSSPLERAWETAAPLAERLNLPVEIEPDLGEVQYGQWTGKPLKEMRETDLWPLLMMAPSLARFPEGESLSEAQARIVGALERLRRKHPDDMIMAVSHADMLKAVVAHYIGLHLDLFQRLVISPAAVSVLRFSPPGIARLERFNDTGTLSDLVVEPKIEPKAEETSETAAPNT